MFIKINFNLFLAYGFKIIQQINQCNRLNIVLVCVFIYNILNITHSEEYIIF